ncbi:PDZ domain-containing protein [Oscillatoriales cyanobacterium LEGE 11467]|uniref:Carboxyl-terminal-processing protease n=1 Tax=Zarconia navalis LEGE 11467 TaxID=1828826 RepID=A0A928VZ02_9CYAN|nr:carboxyl-terminal processing protease CtpA [Zarconia navalis]MBE9040768.1 PDZ domain-containing protein [Zarconia navalis LEGE 11467]
MRQRAFWVGLIVVLQIVVGVFWWSPPALALTEEQKLVSEVWRIVNRSYVDDTFNHQNWWRVRQQALKERMTDRQQAYDVIEKMLARLDDPFTRLLRPQQYKTLQVSTSGELTGVGLQIAIDSETKNLEAIAPIAGTPAEFAGIQPKDLILNIDGVPTTQLTLEEAATRMRGPVGSHVVLRVQRHSDRQIKDLDLVRDRIAINPVYADLRTLDDKTDRQVGYIRLTQFSANATSEMTRALEDLEERGADAYVLDLRNNPGGLLQAGIEIARLWLEDRTIVYTVNRQAILGSFEATDSALTDDPLVVLVNQGTASASEILAGALQDNERATLVGARTFGKGLIQSLFDLSDNAGLAVTVARYETPSHKDINKLGITPDFEIEPEALTRDIVATSKDKSYQTAIDWLTRQGLVASTTSLPQAAKN